MSQSVPQDECGPDSPTMDRDEHLAWCKQRALEYLDRGEIVNAIASMQSDLKSHEGTRSYPAALDMLGMMYARDFDLDGARRWIEGFR